MARKVAPLVSGTPTDGVPVDLCENGEVLTAAGLLRRVVAAVVAVAVAACWHACAATRGRRAVPPRRRSLRAAAHRRRRTSNPASDIGVTPTTITVGVLVSKTSPLGPDVFSGSYYGAMAYLEHLNRKGGINGRKVKVVRLRRQGQRSAATSTASHQLIDHDRIFALAGTTAFSYDGAPYVNQKGVPDIGGQPVGTAYDQYPTCGTSTAATSRVTARPSGGTASSTAAPRSTGSSRRSSGPRARPSSSTTSPRPRASRRSSKTPGCVEGYSVREEQVDLGLANFDSIAVDIAAREGRHRLRCAGRRRKRAAVQGARRPQGQAHGEGDDAQGWTSARSRVITGQPDLPQQHLRHRQHPELRRSAASRASKAFQEAVNRLLSRPAAKTSEWELEGWASAQWLADAMRIVRCEADPRNASRTTCSTRRPTPATGC